jgi:hypothetical protein
MIAADYVKNAVVQYLAKLAVPPEQRLIAADPTPMYLVVSTIVTYDSAATTLTASDLESMVSDSIQKWDAANLETFDNNFRYSKFLAAIDDTDESVVSNQTTVLLSFRIFPVPGNATTYSVSYGNPLRSGDPNAPVLSSTGFAFVDATGVTRPLCFLTDDGNGNAVVYTYSQGRRAVLNPTAGTIDYAAGTLTLSGFNAASYTGHISLMVETLENDIAAASGVILSIDPNDVGVTMEVE